MRDMIGLIKMNIDLRIECSLNMCETLHLTSKPYIYRHIHVYTHMHMHILIHMNICTLMMNIILAEKHIRIFSLTSMHDGEWPNSCISWKKGTPIFQRNFPLALSSNQG